MSVFSFLSEVAFAWVMTYMIHSTIILLACGAMLCFVRSPSHALTERAWKIAATAGSLTTLAGMQIARKDVVAAQTAFFNERISLTEFESLNQLDLELAALNDEIEEAAASADGHSEAEEIANQIARIRAAASLLERNHHGLSERISQE